MSLSRILPLVAALCIAAPATAQPVRPFSLAALKAAQAHGQSVLVDVFAPWCPTCRAQAPTIDALATEPAYAKLLILRLDYDHQTAEKKALGVTRQSTLITYRGTRETGRVLGITDPTQLRSFAATAFR
ncbi:thioredoxin family protein [Sphingomonas sp. AR_OL41]|uniref:thioredoxin family protein n=1 Tax=Sphingomonas sp. AR_OL41 TaxID=3042729 RepID=UPI00248000D8|nr:thioredoxin family protein [Sphingomonas sp. AR_OL41]MDH7971591.1 thioredoxin family protein [Sphingomonas sp. AR_OL41]